MPFHRWIIAGIGVAAVVIVSIGQAQTPQAPEPAQQWAQMAPPAPVQPQQSTPAPQPPPFQQTQPQQPAQQQFAPNGEWEKLPRMQIERQYAGPLRDTVIQRVRDPMDGTICYLYLPITAPHSPVQSSGFVQYGGNVIGSINCIAPQTDRASLPVPQRVPAPAAARAAPRPASTVTPESAAAPFDRKP